jgi:hypothetical protein
MNLINRIITAWKFRNIDKIGSIDDIKVGDINRQVYYLLRNNKNIDILEDSINVYIKKIMNTAFKKASTKQYKRAVERVLAAKEIIGGIRGTVNREHSIEEYKRKQASSPNA